MIPKYVIIGDAQACQIPDTNRLRPLVRDTLYHLIKARLKPKLICEESYEDARKLGIRMGLIKRDHHKLAVIKSVDLLKNICDSRGDIKQGKVRYLLSRMKIMSQSTPADKSLLIYLIKHCECLPNENLAYLGYSFTDPEAMKIADCALTFEDCDDEDVKKSAHVLVKTENVTFTDIYLFMVVCLIKSNVTQSYALYQIGASVSSCLYRFLTITVFQEQLLAHSQFGLLIMIQQVLAIFAMMTKWISSLPDEPVKGSVGELSRAIVEDNYGGNSGDSKHSTSGENKPHGHTRATSVGGNDLDSKYPQHHASSRYRQSLDEPVKTNKGQAQSPGGFRRLESHFRDDTLGSSSMDSNSGGQNNIANYARPSELDGKGVDKSGHLRAGSRAGYSHPSSRMSTPMRERRRVPDSEQPVHLTGTNLDRAIINSKIATNYKQTFESSTIIDDVTYRLAKLHIAYQLLVMIIIMIFGKCAHPSLEMLR